MAEKTFVTAKMKTVAVPPLGIVGETYDFADASVSFVRKTSLGVVLRGEPTEWPKLIAAGWGSA